MKPWVRWCVEHNLQIVVYIALVLTLPVYLALSVKEGVIEWVGEFEHLKRLFKIYSDEKQ